MGWVIGAVINILGSICVNLGTNVMKLGHNMRAAIDLPEAEKPPVRTFRTWQIGVAVFAVGNVLNFGSFGFAAQSTLAALGSVQFVSNVVFATTVLKEKATKRVLIATACIVGGCIVLVLFGNHESKKLTADELTRYYHSIVYIVYMCILALAVIACYMLYRTGKKKILSPNPRESGLWLKLQPVFYSLFSGMVGTQSVLFSKTLSTLLRTSLEGDSQLASWFTWFVLFLFICCAAFWVARLNKGLKLFPAIVIVPTLQICWTLFSIITGGVYFQEYKGFTALSSCMFAFGVMVLFFGVYLLQPPQTGSDADLASYKDLDDEIAMAMATGDGLRQFPVGAEVWMVDLPRRSTEEEPPMLHKGTSITMNGKPPPLVISSPAGDTVVHPPVGDSLIRTFSKNADFGASPTTSPLPLPFVVGTPQDIIPIIPEDTAVDGELPQDLVPAIVTCDSPKLSPRKVKLGLETGQLVPGAAGSLPTSPAPLPTPQRQLSRRESIMEFLGEVKEDFGLMPLNTVRQVLGVGGPQVELKAVSVFGMPMIDFTSVDSLAVSRRSTKDACSPRMRTPRVTGDLPTAPSGSQKIWDQLQRESTGPETRDDSRRGATTARTGEMSASTSGRPWPSRGDPAIIDPDQLHQRLSEEVISSQQGRRWQQQEATEAEAAMRDTIVLVPANEVPEAAGHGPAADARGPATTGFLSPRRYLNPYSPANQGYDELKEFDSNGDSKV